MSSSTNQIFLDRAFSIALYGFGNTSPFPMAGCVIVNNHQIIGEGFYTSHISDSLIPYTLAKVSNKNLLANSTVYLTSLGSWISENDIYDLKKLNISKIVLAYLAPENTLVAKFQNIILIEDGRRGEDELRMNKRYYHAVNFQTPYIILKWAETSDGFIARNNYSSKWISNSFARKLVHKWRSEEDGILVGTNTCLYDNPTLNVRDWTGNNPTRIVIDRNLRLPVDLNVFDGQQSTLCYNLMQAKKVTNLEFVKITTQNSFFHNMVTDLFNRGIYSVIVEGGAATLNQFISNNLWNEARIFRSENKFEDGIASPNHPKGNLKKVEQLEDNSLFWYENNDFSKSDTD